jgi:hypothetical protein
MFMAMGMAAFDPTPRQCPGHCAEEEPYKDVVFSTIASDVKQKYHLPKGNHLMRTSLFL